MQYVWWAVCAVIAYFLGNIQIAVLISKFKFQDDIREHGSRNAGSTNMLRTFGLKAGIITFLLDVVKGILACLIGHFIAGHMGSYIAGLFVVLGHNFPVFFRFRGGKGVATTYGVAFMVSPIAAAITTVYLVVIILLTKLVSVMSITGMLMFLVLTCILCWANTPLIVLCAILTLLILIQHTENIKRIFRGEEKKITIGKRPKESKESTEDMQENS